MFVSSSNLYPSTPALAGGRQLCFDHLHFTRLRWSERELVYKWDAFYRGLIPTDGFYTAEFWSSLIWAAWNAPRLISHCASAALHSSPGEDVNTGPCPRNEACCWADSKQSSFLSILLLCSCCTPSLITQPSQTGAAVLCWADCALHHLHSAQFS